MGRVYDALKRASADKEGGAVNKKSATQKRRNGTQRVPVLGEKTVEHPWESSPLFSRDETAARDSASTAHTEERAGSALSGVGTSREAGATLDAAGTTRARAEFVSLDISAARVEPHLVAVTQPRSAHCEQFRSLRTRLLQAGERKKMRAFV